MWNLITVLACKRIGFSSGLAVGIRNRFTMSGMVFGFYFPVRIPVTLIRIG